MAALDYAVFDNTDGTPQFLITTIAALCPDSPSRSQGELAALIWARLVADACCRTQGELAQRVQNFLFHHQADQALSLEYFDELARLAALRAEAFPDARTIRFHAPIRFGRTRAEAVLLLAEDVQALRADPPGALIAAGTPVLALGSAGSLAQSAGEPLSLVIEATDEDNVMCALSLEDAAKYLKRPVRWRNDLPERAALRFSDALLARGAGAVLTAAGPAAEAVPAALDILAAAASILPRRLDAARMSAAQGLAKEHLLGAPF